MGKTKQQKVKDFLINNGVIIVMFILVIYTCLLYTSPSPRDYAASRMPSSA